MGWQLLSPLTQAAVRREESKRIGEQQPRVDYCAWERQRCLCCHAALFSLRYPLCEAVFHPILVFSHPPAPGRGTCSCVQHRHPARSHVAARLRSCCGKQCRGGRAAEAPCCPPAGTGNRSACSPPAPGSCCTCWSGAEAAVLLARLSRGPACRAANWPPAPGLLAPIFAQRAETPSVTAGHRDVQAVAQQEEKGRGCTAGTALSLHRSHMDSSPGNQETTRQGHGLGKDSNFFHARASCLSLASMEATQQERGQATRATSSSDKASGRWQCMW